MSIYYYCVSMGDFTTFEYYNVPLFMYSMIGLTLGVITLSTVFDNTPDVIQSGVFQAPNPAANPTSGGRSRKTMKKHSKK